MIRFQMLDFRKHVLWVHWTFWTPCDVCLMTPVIYNNMKITPLNFETISYHVFYVKQEKKNYFKKECDTQISEKQSALEFFSKLFFLLNGGWQNKFLKIKNPPQTSCF